jgi:hypothetical protein
LDKDSEFSIANQMERGFLGLVRVSNQATEQVDTEIGKAAMTGVFNLGNVFQLVDDGFHDGALTLEQLISHLHQAILHGGFQLGDQLSTTTEIMWEVLQ